MPVEIIAVGDDLQVNEPEQCESCALEGLVSMRPALDGRRGPMAARHRTAAPGRRRRVAVPIALSFPNPCPPTVQSRNEESSYRLGSRLRVRRPKPGATGPCIRFTGTVLPAVRPWPAAQATLLVLSCLLSTGTALAQTPEEAATESQQITDTFNELDRLGANIANRLQDLARLPGLPAPPPPGLPQRPVDTPSAPDDPPADSGGHADGPPSPPPVTDGAGGTETLEPDPRTESESCGTRDEIDLRLGEIDERYTEYRQTILPVNDDLPRFREDVRDIDKACAQQLNSNIASAIKKLEGIDFEADSDLAVDLMVCVDRLRRETDDEFNAPDISTIRMQILSDELERLTDLTHRVRKLEGALQRAVSKRNRLVEELMELIQYIQEIQGTC